MSEAAACDTSIATVADAVPDVAVIVAAPFATAVTTPEVDTVAMAASEELQATGALGKRSPCWSRTSAVSCSLAPNDPKLKAEGLRTMAVATRAPPVSVGDSELHDASNSVRIARDLRRCTIIEPPRNLVPRPAPGESDAGRRDPRL